MSQTPTDGRGSDNGTALRKWGRRVLFLIVIPFAYLYAFRTIYIEYLRPNYYSFYVDEFIDYTVIGFLLLYYLVYPFLLFVRGKFALHARAALAVLLFFVPTFVVVAEFPEGSRIEAGSRYRIDRVDPDSGSPVTWTIVDGRLVAAGNVLVDGRMYDVEFVEGRCPEIFDGCDDPLEDFAFHDGESAKRAAQALLDQVLLDDVVDKGVIYNFDSLPTQMYGCSHTNICDTVIPYDLVSSDPPLLISSVYNASPGTPDSVGLGVSYEMNADSSQRYLWNYAKFTLSQ